MAFPNLTSFGVEMAALLVKPLPSPPSTTPIGFTPLFGAKGGWYHAETPLVEFFEALREMCRRCMKA